MGETSTWTTMGVTTAYLARGTLEKVTTEWLGLLFREGKKREWTPAELGSNLNKGDEIC